MDFSKLLDNGLWLARIFLIVDEGLYAMAKFGRKTFLSFGGPVTIKGRQGMDFHAVKPPEESSESLKPRR